MARVEIYEEPKPAEMTGLRTLLFSLAHFATRGVDGLTIGCDITPAPLVLLIVFVFAVLCNEPPTYPTAAALMAACLWWFLVMTTGRRILRIIVVAALIAEIYRLLELRWFLPNPLKI